MCKIRLEIPKRQRERRPWKMPTPKLSWLWIYIIIILDRKLYYKSYSSYWDNKIDNMLPQRQTVIQALGNQIDIEDSLCMKYASTNFQSIVLMLIFDIVTIKRNAAVLQKYENNHCITTSKLLRSCI